MKYFLYILAILFLYFNYKIIVSDLKYKKIPNKYLAYLLLIIPFYYIYIFFSFPEINYLLFIGQIFTTFLISFILYYFGIWAAGDAKYLLVLALFIPYIGIVPFIGNIAFILIIYLLIYFFYFYFYKLIKNKLYRQYLIKNIKTDLKEKWKTYKKDKSGTTLNIILKWFVLFLIIFVSIRLIRLYLFKFLFTTTEQSRFLLFINYLEKYNIYLVFFVIGIIFATIYIIRKGISLIIAYLKKKKKDTKKTENLLLLILSSILLSFIGYEYLINPEEIKMYLIRIFTVYIIIYILARILIYSYKITFILGEVDYIKIEKLNIGDIIDKNYILNLFQSQKCLEKYFDNISIQDYITKMPNQINNETLKIVNDFYKITNEYHLKNNTKNFEKVKDIKILKTFSFAPYILSGFFITFLFNNAIWEFIINTLYEIIGKK